MNAYSKFREFMDESGRQSVLKHFSTVYPQWSLEKKEKFIIKFGVISVTKTVELVTCYYALLVGNEVKK